MELNRRTPLHLRPWTPADRPAVAEALASPDMDRQFPLRSSNAKRVDAWLAWASAMTEREHGFAFAVCAEDDRPVASIAAANIDAHDVAWVSYWATARARGLGITGDALTALVPWLHDAAGIWRLELGHRLDNPASGAIAAKAGFLQEGIERGKLRYGGERYDTARWARLSDDPRPPAARAVTIAPASEPRASGPGTGR